MTLKQMLEEGLRRKGYVRVEHKTSGWCWQLPGSENFVWVGENGGLRSGRSISKSWSIQHSGFWKEVHKEWETAKAKAAESKVAVTDYGKLV